MWTLPSVSVAFLSHITAALSSAAAICFPVSTGSTIAQPTVLMNNKLNSSLLISILAFYDLQEFQLL